MYHADFGQGVYDLMECQVELAIQYPWGLLHGFIDTAAWCDPNLKLQVHSDLVGMGVRMLLHVSCR